MQRWYLLSTWHSRENTAVQICHAALNTSKAGIRFYLLAVPQAKVTVVASSQCIYLITKGVSSELSCKDCVGSSDQMHCTLCPTYANEFQHPCIPDKHQTLWWIVRPGIQIAMNAKINKESNTKIIDWDPDVENCPLFSIPHAKAQFILIASCLNYYSSQPSHGSPYLQSTFYTADIRIFLKRLPKLVTLFNVFLAPSGKLHSMTHKSPMTQPISPHSSPPTAPYTHYVLATLNWPNVHSFFMFLCICICCSLCPKCFSYNLSLCHSSFESLPKSFPWYDSIFVWIRFIRQTFL